MKEFIEVMKALKDPNRVKALKILQHGELCVCEIREALGIAQSSVSKHLGILDTAGLVERRKEGLWSYYRIAATPATPYAATLLGSLRHWLEDDTELAEAITRLPEIRSHNLCKKE